MPRITFERHHRAHSKWKGMARRSVLSSLLLVCFPLVALGQVAITGKITGVVTDSSGAAIPHAAVTVRGPALMAPRTVMTQVDGTFLVDQLPIGIYEVTVTTPGFKTYVQRGVVINAGFTATLTVSLDVGQLQEVVTVMAETVVDVKTHSLKTTFDHDLLQSIPSGRDPWSTVAQVPGATLTRFDIGGSESYQQSTMQVHGSKPGQQVWSFNGLRLNWPGSSGGFTAFYIDYDSLQEFQVVTDAAPPEVGVGGVYMNMVTKSGSNEVHGLVAAYYLSSALQKSINRPLFKGVPVPAGIPFMMLRDTTANAGGPILKDRWWIFGAYRRYDISQRVLAVRRPDGTNISDVNHQSNTVLRSDFQITPNHRVNFQWLYNSQNRFFRRSTAFAFVDDQASWRQIEPAYILQGQWTGALTHNFILDARLGYLHLLFPLSYQPTVKPTDVSVADLTLSTLKGAAQYNFLNPAQTLRFAVSASYFKGAFLGGSHNLKFGYEVSTNRNGNFFDINGNINVFFNNNVPLRVDVFNTPIRAKSIFRETAAFFQDSWTLRQRLTVNAGVRFDHFRTFNPEQCSPEPSAFRDLFPTRCFPQSPDIAHWNDFVPRLGVAFDVTGKRRSVIRAGFNRFVLIEGTRLAEAVNPNILGGRSYRWTDANGDGFPQPSEFLAPTNFIGSFGGIVTRIDPRLKRPYSDQVNVGCEQQVYKDLRIGVGYFYRTNRRLISRRNMAVLPTDYTPTATLEGQPIVNPLTGQPLTLFNMTPSKVGKVDFLITNIPDLDDNAYHGVEITAVKRMSQNWQLLAGLTIQRAKGTFDAGLSDDFNNPNRDINRRANILDLDATYVFKLDGSYAWPYGFTTSVNYQHYTGYPLRPTNVFRGLSQLSETIALEPRGRRRLPDVDVLNLRISRMTRVTEQVGIELIVDFFNITNNNAVTDMVQAFGPNFLRPVNVLNPFVTRLGARVTF
jgi:hypothetical protein